MSPSLQDPYCNRKGGLSQNVMAACDFNFQFMHVNAGWKGSAAEARVLQDALSHGFYIPDGKYYLVDAKKQTLLILLLHSEISDISFARAR